MGYHLLVEVSSAGNERTIVDDDLTEVNDEDGAMAFVDQLKAQAVSAKVTEPVHYKLTHDGEVVWEDTVWPNSDQPLLNAISKTLTESGIETIAFVTEEGHETNVTQLSGDTALMNTEAVPISPNEESESYGFTTCRHFSAAVGEGPPHPNYPYDRQLSAPLCLHPDRADSGKMVVCEYYDCQSNCGIYDPIATKVLETYSLSRNSGGPGYSKVSLIQNVMGKSSKTSYHIVTELGGNASFTEYDDETAAQGAWGELINELGDDYEMTKLETPLDPAPDPSYIRKVLACAPSTSTSNPINILAELNAR